MPITAGIIAIPGLMVFMDGQDTVLGIMDIMIGDILITEGIMDTTGDITGITTVAGGILIIIIPIIGEVIPPFPETGITVNQFVEEPYQAVHPVFHLQVQTREYPEEIIVLLLADLPLCLIMKDHQVALRPEQDLQNYGAQLKARLM